jgi:hypothetical protein
MEFLAYFFNVHIDFNTEIIDDETVFIISSNYEEYFNGLIDLAKEIGAEYRVTDSNYLIITTKQTYKIDSRFRALGY